MNDFDQSSYIEIKNSENVASGQGVIGTVGKELIAPISSEGTTVTVSGILNDKSGNQQLSNHTVSKLDYFNDSSVTDYLTANVEENIDFMAAIPGLASNEQLVVGINKLGGGYRIANGTETLFEESAGELQKMLFSGTALVTQVNVNGETRLQYYALNQSGTLDAPISHIQYGQLISASGNTVWFNYKQLI